MPRLYYDCAASTFRACRAITTSSSVGTTSTATREVGARPHRRPNSPRESTDREHGAHDGQQRAPPPVHGDGRLGHEDAVDESGDGARETVELVLTEDRRTQHRHHQRGENSKD